eukprot:CCRYP_019004-RA/>CCRYP_019004-RA protein AED:0.38 eAED:0.38 QI:286/1/0.5/1/0/0/2/0/76
MIFVNSDVGCIVVCVGVAATSALAVGWKAAIAIRRIFAKDCVVIVSIVVYCRHNRDEVVRMAWERYFVHGDSWWIL